MKRSSPVQQWLDSLPSDAPKDDEKDNERSQNEDSEESKHEESTSEIVTVVEQIHNNQMLEHSNMDISVGKEMWKRKSVDNSLLMTGSSDLKNKNKLQRGHSIQSEGLPPKFKNPFYRDYSLQSDASGSSGSSVLNVLGARKVDAESVLLALGFGLSEKQQQLQRIPDRFLTPSKLRGISTEKFIKEEHHSMRMHDCGVFGYRGLTGNPHVPPSTIVAKIMERILQDNMCREEALMKSRRSVADIETTPSAFISTIHDN